MPNYRMSSRRKPVLEVGDVLGRVIRREGAELLSQILKDRAQNPPTPAEAASAARFSSRQALREASNWWRRIRRDGLVPASRVRLEGWLYGARRNWETGRALAQSWSRNVTDAKTYYQNLSSPLERTEFLVLLGLSSASFIGGLCVGSQVPSFDLRLFPVGRGSDAITVHSAPLLSLEVSLEWMKAVLGRTLIHPELADVDRRRLNGMIRLCNQLSGGIEAGVAAREKVKRAVPFLGRRAHKVRSIPMDAQSYQVADSLLAALSGLKNQG